MTHPLFVYGWLLPGGRARARIDPYIARTAPATVPADAVGHWPGAEVASGIAGELVWFVSDQEAEAQTALQKLSNEIELGFELTGVEASYEHGHIAARLYRWRGPRQDFAAYLVAAERKIAIAEWELESLERRLSGDPGQLPVDAPVPVQADFEGVLNAFDSAVDQVTEALRVDHRSRAGALPDIDQCLRAVRDWLSSTHVGEVAEVRNDATHAYYDKRPYDELWHLWSTRRGRPVNRGDILSFARAAVAHLQNLRPVLICLRRTGPVAARP